MTTEWQPIATCPDNTTVVFWDGGLVTGRMEHDVLRVDGSRMDHFWGGGGLDDERPPTRWMLPGKPEGEGGVMVATEQLQRIVRFYPAYDKRDLNPRKNYGVHGVDLLMLVLGRKGAIQFRLSTSWMLPHVQVEQDQRILQKAQAGVMNRYDISALYHPLPADLGYHAKEPQYDGQEPIESDCKWTGGPCYYDGSGLNADPVFQLLLTEGDEGVWRRLEADYRERFEL